MSEEVKIAFLALVVSRLFTHRIFKILNKTSSSNIFQSTSFKTIAYVVRRGIKLVIISDFASKYVLKTVTNVTIKGMVLVTSFRVLSNYILLNAQIFNKI